MKILAIETSTEWCSVALADGARSLCRREHAGQTHSARVLPMVDALLAEAGLRLADLNALAFGAGPGSFTGLRIACAVTQGLALGAGLPVIGVSTLESVAEQTGCERVLALLDARMAEVYWAAYVRVSGRWQTVCPPVLSMPDAVAVPGSGWQAAGSGWDVLGSAHQARLAGQLCGHSPGLVPDAAAMLPLARAAWLRGEARDAAEAAPVYLRDKVALTRDERAAHRSG